jgi:hypothetical protein
VGKKIYYPERGERKVIKKGDIEHLQPFESALIKTIEKISLPKNNLLAFISKVPCQKCYLC